MILNRPNTFFISSGKKTRCVPANQTFYDFFTKEKAKDNFLADHKFS